MSANERGGAASDNALEETKGVQREDLQVVPVGLGVGFRTVS